MAQRLNEAVSAGGHGSIYALAPGYQPFLFYLSPSPRYIPTVDALPASEPLFLLVKEGDFRGASARLDALNRLWQPTLSVDEKNRGHYRLIRVAPRADR